ncbi:hypothetical protein [Sinomonas humi]|uniref:hypothetical protein n=1 Tax=Sinomonas humi TaxID=1338436 RepID=UPI00068DB2C2|nr:hypothetical protein [Sinomonas humi]
MALIGLDAETPTQLASLLRPLELLPGIDAAVLMRSRRPGLLPGQGWRWLEVPLGGAAAVCGPDDAGAAPSGSDRTALPEVLGALRAVVTIGHFLPVGALVNRWARAAGAARLVVQHGLLTPHAPPLPPESHFLAFSDEDGEFAAAQRDDVVCSSIGSQLLWAARNEQSVPSRGGRPLYLGQLHGAELPRGTKGRVTADFCRATGAIYRPHPAETDIASRLQHALWERLGIEFDRSGRPLRELERPVVSAFSTGVLEAAARGVPAWVVFPEAPRWLLEFWDRYSMRRWGGPPTPPPVRPAREPAAAVADHVLRLLGHCGPQVSDEPSAPQHPRGRN